MGLELQNIEYAKLDWLITPIFKYRLSLSTTMGIQRHLKDSEDHRRVYSYSTVKYLWAVDCEDDAAMRTERNEGYKKDHRSNKRSLWRPTYININ